MYINDSYNFMFHTYVQRLFLQYYVLFICAKMFLKAKLLYRNFKILIIQLIFFRNKVDYSDFKAMLALYTAQTLSIFYLQSFYIASVISTKEYCGKAHTLNSP